MMVRNYKRKTMRKAIQQDVLDQAKNDLQQGDSIRSVAVKYGMDESTLRKRLKKVILNYMEITESLHPLRHYYYCYVIIVIVFYN
jgi:hypothetical protein